MRRLFLIVLVALGVTSAGAQLQAQSSVPQQGTPPVVERITVSPPDASGVVTITGDNGTVFPNAYVYVRNLYTGATVATHAGGTGSFSAIIYGPGNTPFWISPSTEMPTTDILNRSGSLPGGPGAILYGARPGDSLALPGAKLTTRIAIDGDVGDWAAYSDAALHSDDSGVVYALKNDDSLYVAIAGANVNNAYSQIELRFKVDLNTYTLTLDPRQSGDAQLALVNPILHEPNHFIVSARQGRAIEILVPLTFVDRAGSIELDSLRWLDTNGIELNKLDVSAAVPAFDEDDGVYRAADPLDQTAQMPQAFSLGGMLPPSGRNSHPIWSAQGRAESLAVEPGATWRLELDVSYGLTDVPADVRMIGVLGLQPVARAVDGAMIAVGGVASNNGWSSILTPGDIAIDNLRSAVTLGEAVAAPYQLMRESDDLRFPLDFAVTLPDDLPPGLYVPVFEGYTQVIGEARQAWDSGSASLPTRLPLVVSSGTLDTAGTGDTAGTADANGTHDSVRLPFALFYDNPSDGSRGILPDEDQGVLALSNRVRFDSPVYVLPPFEPASTTPIQYPLEPYLPDLLPNRYDTSGAPLIPFEFPGGILQGSVTKPDGTVEDFGSVPLVQNQLSTVAEDERALFGEQSPVDVYRLTTRDPRLTSFSFDQYGDYTINLTGSLRDLWGNRYTGGGTYHVVAAEPLDLTPGVLSGTPFQVGDVINLGLHLAPGVPADVTVTVRVYPLDGGDPIERKITGRANRNGYFQPDDAPFVLTTQGEYVVDYQARYLAPDQRLWAASLRGAGVIAASAEDRASRSTDLIAHGERGVPAITSDLHPAWFDLHQFAQVTGASDSQTRLNLPYQSGDEAWIGDSRSGGMSPEITVQDRAGAYADLLLNALPGYVGEAGRSLHALVTQQEIPLVLVDGATANAAPALHPDQLVSDSYGYVSAVRPNVTVRQFVAGADDGGLPLYWDEDDPLNRQIGAGINGDRPGDFIFLFGGAVVRAEGQDADGNPAPIRDTAIYGALAVVTTPDQPPRIYPPGRGTSGGADGGALLTFNGDSVDAFVNLTALQPGDVLRLGNTVGVAGQVAPLLPATVTTTLTAPSGRVHLFSTRANDVGYFYDPSARFTVDEVGIWTVSVQVTLDSPTSAGEAVPPLVTGGVLGANGGDFSVYVLPQTAAPLDWNPLLTDQIIPVVSPYNFSFTLPDDWSNVHAYYTLSTPGMIFEQSELRVFGHNFSYSYSPPLQSRAYPNLENEGRASGAYVSDTRTLTFVATGVDSSGVMQIRSRTFTLMHDRLVTTE